jgi:hypothetical protein
LRKDLAALRIYYNQRLAPLLAGMERKRKGLILSLALAFLLVLAGLIGVLVLKNFPLTILLFLAAGLVLVWSNQAIRQFKQSFKPTIIRTLLDFMDDKLNYGTLSFQPNQKVGLDDFLSTGILPDKPYKYLGEDFLTGKIGSFPFSSSELLVQEPARVKGGLETVFKGFFIKVEMDTAFEGKLWVFSKRDKPDHAEALKVIYQNGGELVRDEESSALLFYATKDFPIPTFTQQGVLDFLVSRKKELESGFFWHVAGDTMYLAIREEKDLLEPYIFSSNKRFDLIHTYYYQLSRLFEFVEVMEKYV